MNMGFILEGALEGRKLSLVCTGVIRDYESFKAFKSDLFDIVGASEIDHLKQKAFDELEVKFADSHPLPDCLIGFFLKLLERDKISISLMTNENKMLSFFISLFLDEKLNVRLYL